MTNSVEATSQFTDAEYIKKLANLYRFSEVTEYKQHCARLDAIVERLEALDKKVLVVAANEN